MEHRRCMCLCVIGRTLVNQQITHAHVRVAEIRAEQVVPEEVHQATSSGMTHEELAALMPRAVKGRITPALITRQRSKERRQNLVVIFRRRRFDHIAEKLGVLTIAGEHAGDSVHVEVDTLTRPSHDEQRQVEARRPQPRHHTVTEIAGGEHDGAHLSEVSVGDVHDLTPRVDKTRNLWINGDASLGP